MCPRLLATDLHDPTAASFLAQTIDEQQLIECAGHHPERVSLPQVIRQKRLSSRPAGPTKYARSTDMRSRQTDLETGK
jgi:hypothetical protein